VLSEFIASKPYSESLSTLLVLYGQPWTHLELWEVLSKKKKELLCTRLPAMDTFGI
jgi:hypothetical protein